MSSQALAQRKEMIMAMAKPEKEKAICPANIMLSLLPENEMLSMSQLMKIYISMKKKQ